MAKEKKSDFCCLDILKKNYEKEKQKYKLPSFQQLNEEFEIERAAERETDMLLRELRKAMTEKAIAFLRFVELLLNPTNAPFFMFSIIKNLTASDKKLIEGIYKQLCEFEIKAIALDMEYSEKAEAEFIKYCYGQWKGMKVEMKELSEAISKAWHMSAEKKERDYFG